MLGTKTNQVFTSRWKALSWSLGVMALAYCSIPAAETEAQQAEIAAKAASNDTLAQRNQQKPTPGIDPWADPLPNAAAKSEVDQVREKVAVLENFGN